MYLCRSHDTSSDFTTMGTDSKFESELLIKEEKFRCVGRKIDMKYFGFITFSSSFYLHFAHIALKTKKISKP